MAPKRTRTLSSNASRQTDKLQPKTRSRELTLGRETREHVKGAATRERKLEGSSFLANHLAEKKVVSKKLPQTDAELLKLEQALVVKDKKREELSDSGGSTSSEWLEEPKGGRHRSLPSRKRRRLQELVHTGMETGQSLLEVASVSTRVREQYKKRMEELNRHFQDLHCSLDQPAQIDQALVTLFNTKFLEGEGSHYGDYCMAALMDRHPTYGKHGSSKVPAAWKALKGWRKMCPSRSRLAFPLPVWCAISWRMMVHGHSQKALFNLLQVSTYHRPGTLLGLRRMGLVPPTHRVTGHWSVVTSLTETSQVSKIGDKDDSILLDSSWLQFIDPLLRGLRKGPKEEKVWDFDYGEYLSVFQRCCQELQVSLVPYQARHSGPSIDRASRERDQDEVRKRGCWLTRKSVNRYEKAGRLAATWHKLSASTQASCLAAERHIEAIMLGRDYPHIALPV